SGFTTGPRTPREVNVLGVSLIDGDVVLRLARSAPASRTTSVPAASAGDRALVAVDVNWNIGTESLPPIPAVNWSIPDGSSTPAAPAALAFTARTVDPHLRLVSLSSQLSHTNLSATAALSVSGYGRHPSRLDLSASWTTGLVRSSLSMPA